MRAVAELLLERYGIVTRETVLAEGIPGGFAGLYGELANLETLGTARRGYFVEGLGGAQFALPAAIERLRTMRTDEPAGALVLAATDPANPFGATLPWPKRDDDSDRRPARVPGAYVVTIDAEPVLYVERGGKGLLPLRARRRGLAAAGAGGAGRGGPARARSTPRHRALRRRAGGRVGHGRAADRAGLPAEPAPADAQRLMSRENVEIVRRAFEAWNAGDPEAAIELLDPDIEWRLPPNFPDAESWRGRDAVVAGLTTVTESWDEFRVEVQELIDAGDRVVALVRFRGRAAITGLDLGGVSVDGQVWTVRDGKAIHVQMYNGSSDALRTVDR